MMVKGSPSALTTDWMSTETAVSCSQCLITSASTQATFNPLTCCAELSEVVSAGVLLFKASMRLNMMLVKRGILSSNCTMVAA